MRWDELRGREGGKEGGRKGGREGRLVGCYHLAIPRGIYIHHQPR